MTTRPTGAATGPSGSSRAIASGYLQADAYAGYDGLHARGLVEVGCWAHARRKFHEARTSDPERSHAVIAWIGRLYDVGARGEGRWLGRRAADGGPRRAVAAAPGVVRGLAGGGGEEGAAEEPDRRGDRLCAVELGGPDRGTSRRRSWRSTTTPSENAIRPIALGRKNWLHLGSDRGGKTAATLLSLVQSCKDLGNEPFAYLRDVLDRVSTHPDSRIDELLPDRWKPPGPAGRLAEKDR